MGKTYCCGLHPQGSMYLIAIVDIILGFVSTLLSIVALVNLQKVFGQLETDQFEDSHSHSHTNNNFPFAPHESTAVIDDDSNNEQQTKSGINEFAHMHGQMIILLLLSVFYLVFALGLLLGIRKELDCPIKTWFIYGCTLTLFGGISIIILTISSGYPAWLLLNVFILIRGYEIWIAFDFMKNSRFSSSSTTSLISSLATMRSPSTERLHNV